MLFLTSIRVRKDGPVNSQRLARDFRATMELNPGQSATNPGALFPGPNRERVGNGSGGHPILSRDYDPEGGSSGLAIGRPRFPRAPRRSIANHWELMVFLFQATGHEVAPANRLSLAATSRFDCGPLMGETSPNFDEGFWVGHTSIRNDGRSAVNPRRNRWKHKSLPFGAGGNPLIYEFFRVTPKPIISPIPPGRADREVVFFNFPSSANAFN